MNFEEHHHHHTKKKRVGKACDSCRIKKTKCNGNKPCSRCISDNKICVFTEKRKNKEKPHPPGYVELLETRLNLLTKSLEKLIWLLKDNLPFINDIVLQYQQQQNQQLYNQSDSDSSISSPNDETNQESIPINEVISYLINEENLLKNLPVEWENGAIIASKLSMDNQKNINYSTRQFANHKQNLAEENLTSPPTSTNSINNDSLSDDLEVKKSNSLFLNNFDSNSNSSMTSLTNKVENYDLDSPITLTPTNSNTLKRTASTSHTKFKNNGHIHKPISHSRSHLISHDSSLFKDSTTNFYQPPLLKSQSFESDLLLSNDSNTLINGDSIFQDDDLLPSNAFKLEIDHLNDSSNVDNLINNPFLNQ